MTMPIALTIAGSDSSAGAGVGADLKTFAAFDVYGVCAITAITAQNTLGVQASHVLPAPWVEEQLMAVIGDLRPRAVKVGMLGDAAIVRTVADTLGRHALGSIVLDPVFWSSSGRALLEPAAIALMRETLFPLATLLTPNIPEAELLLGAPIDGVERMRDAAVALRALGPAAVLLKGGHLAGPPIDVLATAAGLQEFHGERLETTNTHGTGCTLASAIVALLAHGMELPLAVAAAKEYVAGAMRQAPGLGSGYGPLRHDWLTASNAKVPPPAS